MRDKPSAEPVLKVLNETRMRATYAAVSELLGLGTPQNVGKALGTRRPEASWVVSKETGLPTGYSPAQVHPDLQTNQHIITSGDELRKLIERHGR